MEGVIHSEDPDSPEGHHEQTGKAGSKASTEPDVLSRECKLVRTAEGILLRRRRRNSEFDSGIFDEPAWDMLLELYVRETSGTSCTAEELKAASAVASSTAERWLHYLEKEGLAVCRYYPRGQGTVFVALTNRARQAFDRYLAAIGDLNLTAANSESSLHQDPQGPDQD